ncbi:aminobenzoate oxygenase [Vibrio sp. V12_P9A6T4]|uniref:diiron oxygenase n=1 Tax=Vibrio sp. V12_P9A6T4 TaxID=1938667 RepID=UPI000B9F2BAC|nr:diiron oxygenase [Vibrio sp. V12_P9A6T4]OXX51473.1 aminobenzoate oxygenase [Vibrio sp. V12_P9A6T4]
MENNNVGTMLKKLSKLWEQRAIVNNDQIKYQELIFDKDKSDFSEILLPFAKHDAWIEASDSIKSQCLSYAWGLYNLKTIYIECDIVTPACEDLIKSPPSNSNMKGTIQDVMSEALLDEALHTRMSLLASNYIYDRRGLVPFHYQGFNLIKWRKKLLSECNSEWERRLTRFSIACASETLITDYLKTMAEDVTIQSVCHEVTKAHAMDEWSHSSVFSLVATDIVNGLSNKEKNFLATTMRKTVKMFANNELGAWETVLSALNFDGYKDMINDTNEHNEIEVFSGSVESVISRIGLSKTTEHS